MCGKFYKMIGLEGVSQEVQEQLRSYINEAFDADIMFKTFPYMSIEKFKFKPDINDKTFLSVTEIRNEPLNYKEKELNFEIDRYTFKMKFINWATLRLPEDEHSMNLIKEFR